MELLAVAVELCACCGKPIKKTGDCFIDIVLNEKFELFEILFIHKHCRADYAEKLGLCSS